MKIFKDKDRRKGLIGTILFHAVLFIAFIFLGLTYTFPPEEEGIEVNFGDSETGFGEEEPATTPVETQPESVPETREESGAPIIQKEEIVVQEKIKTVDIDAEKKKVEQTKKIAAKYNLCLVKNEELTPYLHLRNLPDRLARMILFLGNLLPIKHAILPSMLGSMALQQCLYMKIIEYRFLVFEKQTS